MSFAGVGSFGNYDRTAQNTGMPTVTRPATHDDADKPSDEAGGVGVAEPAGTRATSVTEMGTETPARDKETTPGPDTASEINEAGAPGDAGDDGSEHRRNDAVQALARTYTTHSQATGVEPGQNVFLAAAAGDSPLNPNGPNFRAHAWAKAVVDMVATEGHQFRTSGVCFQNLNVYGYGAATDYQKDVFNVWLEVAGLVRRIFGYGKRRIDILRNFDGVVRKGEMLVVLGPPGSGCSSLLKTIAGETSGLYVDSTSYFNYQGMTAQEMHTHHRGEAIYTAETDAHFPQLSVRDTLTFAARARAPRRLPAGVPRSLFANHLRDVVLAMFDISHTIDTRVGNEYVRGVSGGERKRVTIAEAALSGAPLQCWDNSTRGLDSANAIEFVKTVRMGSELFGSTACVSIYQAPQTAYDMFDKAAVLYEGRQIFFGRTDHAKQYFVNLGFHCAARATTPDFLTSMTSPQERIIREGFEGRAPRTPDEFAEAWRKSAEYKALQADIEDFKTSHPFHGPDADAFRASKQAQQARGQRAKSPFTLSYPQQVQLCLWRGWQRLRGDPSLTLGSLIGNFGMSLVIASVFYNIQPTTTSFFQRGALLFFACLMNAFASALEILTLWSQRPIVEKHARYALYHPSAEAVASMLCDLPYKVMNTIIFNTTLYFMTGLRREPGAFFFFLIVSFATTLAMSMIFRTIASASRSLSQAMVPAAIIILALVIFTGFVIPIDYMLSWCRWLNYLDPLAYAFEALMVNEFHNREFICTDFVPNPLIPGYANVGAASRTCSTIGSQRGVNTVNGDAYVGSAFRYYWENRWRDFGIILVFMAGFLVTYMVAAELVSAKKSKGEVLVFRRGHKPAAFKEHHKGDPEAGKRISGPAVLAASVPTAADKEAALIQKQTSVFHWQDVSYEVKIKKETRRILDNIDGFIRPGTLTALMGVSGAGKTTLLDCLADRTAMGVITGEMFVDGHERDTSFQRKTGYVQQQDLHLETTTVREALNFSALLRQPANVPRAEKLAYVDEVIKLLDMEEYADAVVGVPGEGLNVEQRKRLTIGVELAAKPPLLLFVDEPTSGLDSQTSWAILDLLEKLTKSGQAILCTIHQPSAMLFQRFNRLLFLAKDGKSGKTVYFGDIGENSKIMTSYFERNGAPSCPPEANPAEWMLEVIGAAPGSTTDVDWFETWRRSPEHTEIRTELQRLKDEPAERQNRKEDRLGYREFAAGFWGQLFEVTHRVFQQYWRTPSYIYSKVALCVLVGLFVGFVFFQAPLSIQGLQNQLFSIFQLMTVFSQLCQQQMPHFVTQRSLYEVRERPSKVYGWKVFMLSQIIVELPWNSLMALLMFVCWYFPVGLHHNAEAAGQGPERGGLMFLLLLAFLLFTCTFTDLIIPAFETAEAGGNIANLLFTLCLLFCGVLTGPILSGFWTFLYRLSPFTYLVNGMLSVAVGNVRVTCASNEYLHFNAPSNATCAEYMGVYIEAAGGYLEDTSARDECSFCPISDTNKYLAGVGANYDDRWQNFGIIWAYIAFNILGALGVYWLARVPKNKKVGKAKEKEA